MSMQNQCCCGNGLYFGWGSGHAPGGKVELAKPIAGSPVFVGTDVEPSLGASATARGVDPVRKRLLVRKSTGAIQYYNRLGVDMGVQLWSSGSDAGGATLLNIVYQPGWGYGSANTVSGVTLPRVYDASGGEVFAATGFVVNSTQPFQMGGCCTDPDGNCWYVQNEPMFGLRRIYRNGTPVGIPPEYTVSGEHFHTMFHDGSNLYISGRSYLDEDDEIVAFLGIYQAEVAGAFEQPTPILLTNDILVGDYDVPRIRGMVYDAGLDAVEIHIVDVDDEEGWYSINLGLTRNIFLSAEELDGSSPTPLPYRWVVMKPDE